MKRPIQTSSPLRRLSLTSRTLAVFGAALAISTPLMGINQCHQPDPGEFTSVARIDMAYANLMPEVPEDPMIIRISADYSNQSDATVTVKGTLEADIQSLESAFYATMRMDQETDQVITLQPGEAIGGVPYMKGELYDVKGDWPCGEAVSGKLYVDTTADDGTAQLLVVELSATQFSCVY